MAVQWLRLRLPLQVLWVRSLVGELGSHMPHDQNIKWKQCCSQFNEDLKKFLKKKKKNQFLYFFPSTSLLPPSLILGFKLRHMK